MIIQLTSLLRENLSPQSIFNFVKKTGRVENLLFVESKLFLLSYKAIQ